MADKEVEMSLAPEYRALQDAFERLQKKISPGGIIGALHSRDLLLLNEVDTIRSKAATLEKNEELLLAMYRRSPTQVLQFCQFLLGEQCHCGNILKEALQARGVDTSTLTVATLEPSAVTHVAAKYYPQIDELDVALGDLVQKMKDSTKKSKNLKTYCIRFLTTLSRIHSHDTKDALDRLAAPDCQNEEAIDIIQRFVDPLDCRLLYKIVSALEDEQLSKAWDEYCQRSKQACRITLEQCRKVAIRPHRSPPSGITLGIQTKISPSDITIQKILQLKDFLITKVGLEEIDFDGFACSAVALFFTIGRDRLPVLIRLLSCHQKALLDFSIVTVFVPGEFFYDVSKDQEYPCPKDEKVKESMGREEVEKERLQNQVQSLVHDNLKLQDENRLLEKQLLQRLDALQEMMGRGAETQPQGEGDVPEQHLPVAISKEVSELSKPSVEIFELQKLPQKKYVTQPLAHSLKSSLEETEALFEEYGMKVKTWSDVPKAVKTLRERDSALAEKKEALEERDKALGERDKALREKDELVRQMAIIQPTFESVQSAFIRYEIEVGAWEDVPNAVQQLAYKQGKEPLPDALVQTATASDVLMVWEIAKVVELKSWPEVAAHLGCSPEYIMNVHKAEIRFRYQECVNEDSVKRFYKRCLIQVSADWAANREGTGNVPRTLKTVLEAVRRSCINSEEGLANLSRFKTELMIGTE